MMNPVILSHISGKKCLWDFNADELKLFSIPYLVLKASPIELSNIWFKLPAHYRWNENLKKRLPCNEHYNQEDQFDGPPPAREDCKQCASSFEKI